MAYHRGRTIDAFHEVLSALPGDCGFRQVSGEEICDLEVCAGGRGTRGECALRRGYCLQKALQLLEYAEVQPEHVLEVQDFVFENLQVLDVREGDVVVVARTGE